MHVLSCLVCLCVICAVVIWRAIPWSDWVWSGGWSLRQGVRTPWVQVRERDDAWVGCWVSQQSVCVFFGFRSSCGSWWLPFIPPNMFGLVLLSHLLVLCTRTYCFFIQSHLFYLQPAQLAVVGPAVVTGVYPSPPRLSSSIRLGFYHAGGSFRLPTAGGFIIDWYGYPFASTSTVPV